MLVIIITQCFNTPILSLASHFIICHIILLAHNISVGHIIVVKWGKEQWARDANFVQATED